MDNNINHCLPLNMSPNNSEIQGIDKFLLAYGNILNKIKLYRFIILIFIIDKAISVIINE